MYAEFYGLRGEPFLLTPDHRFYYDSSVHSQAMAYLTYGMRRGEGFIVITGDIGAGKTTLVKQLCSSVDSQKIIAAHIVTTLVSGSDLLRMVASAIGIKDPPTEKSALLLSLQSYFEAAHRENRRVLLIIDEAQNLSVSALEELRMLSNFQLGESAPFQSFLVGQPQFRTLLANPDLEQLRQRVIASYHLGPMDRRECGDYLSHRLRLVGWVQDPYFEPRAVDAIYEHTGGIPRRINTLCSRLMLLGYLDDLHRFSADEVKKVAADLATETSFEGAKGAGTNLATVRETSLTSSGDIHSRLAGLEQRLSRQENFMRQAAAAVHSFLDLYRPESR
jgi:putative secretion ATPase (PEP-CTERM system associated)